MIDARANSEEKITPPAPLPYVSRSALRRVAHAMPVPTACSCCGGQVELVENSLIYNGHSYGCWPYAYLCLDCRAYVGLHPDTDLPLGTLADEPLRKARNSCKQPFERIWRGGLMTRKNAYRWLASCMGMTADECHFGLFNVEQCEQARRHCEQYLAGNA